MNLGAGGRTHSLYSNQTCGQDAPGHLIIRCSLGPQGHPLGVGLTETLDRNEARAELVGWCCREGEDPHHQPQRPPHEKAKKPLNRGRGGGEGHN